MNLKKEFFCAPFSGQNDVNSFSINKIARKIGTKNGEKWRFLAVKWPLFDPKPPLSPCGLDPIIRRPLVLPFRSPPPPFWRLFPISFFLDRQSFRREYLDCNPFGINGLQHLIIHSSC